MTIALIDSVPKHDKLEYVHDLNGKRSAESGYGSLHIDGLFEVSQCDGEEGLL